MTMKPENAKTIRLWLFALGLIPLFFVSISYGQRQLKRPTPLSTNSATSSSGMIPPPVSRI